MKGRRVVRLVKILTTLQSGESYAADDLSKLFNTSRRTIFRDLKELQAIGVPFRYDPKSGGYVLNPDFFLPPLDFSVQEALSLLVVIHKLSGQIQAPYRKSALLAALKIENNLPSRIRGHCVEALSSISAKVSAQAPLGELDRIFTEVQRAIIRRRKVLMRYQSLFEGKTIELEVCPYKLSYNRRAWYLLAFSEVHKEVRTFKLNRIKELEVTSKRFSAKEFDAEEYFGKAWSMIPEGRIYHIKLRFLPKVAHNIAEVQWHSTQKVDFKPDGSAEVEFRVDGLQEITWWVLGYGDQVEVIKPKALRRQIQATAKGMLLLNSKS